MHPSFERCTFPFCLHEKRNKFLNENHFEKSIKLKEIFTLDMGLDEAVYGDGDRDDGHDGHGGDHGDPAMIANFN